MLTLFKQWALPITQPYDIGGCGPPATHGHPSLFTVFFSHIVQWLENMRACKLCKCTANALRTAAEVSDAIATWGEVIEGFETVASRVGRAIDCVGFLMGERSQGFPPGYGSIK